MKVQPALFSLNFTVPKFEIQIAGNNLCSDSSVAIATAANNPEVPVAQTTDAGVDMPPEEISDECAPDLYFILIPVE